MKKIIFLFVLCCSASYAMLDSDTDGIPDDLDICPHVQGVRGYDGCPSMNASVFSHETKIADQELLSCVGNLFQKGGVIFIVPTCNDSYCYSIDLISGMPLCSYYYPAMTNSNGDAYPVGTGFLFR